MCELLCAAYDRYGVKRPQNELVLKWTKLEETGKRTLIGSNGLCRLLWWNFLVDDAM